MPNHSWLTSLNSDIKLPHYPRLGPFSLLLIALEMALISIVAFAGVSFGTSYQFFVEHSIEGNPVLHLVEGFLLIALPPTSFVLGVLSRGTSSGIAAMVFSAPTLVLESFLLLLTFSGAFDSNR